MKNKNRLHAFHLVDPSPWPFISAIGALTMIFGGVLYMHGYVLGSFLYKFGIVIVIFMMYSWWRDVVREGTFESQHSFILFQKLCFFLLFFGVFFTQVLILVFLLVQFGRLLV
jgi:cytochrome c oxidase subunit 3